MITQINKLTKGILHLFYPQLCEACHQPLLDNEEVLCIGCEQHLPLTNYHAFENNETVSRLSGRFPFEYATSLAYFTEENLLQHLLHRLKYKERELIGLYFGKQLGAVIESLNWQPDAIIAVPLHKKKETKRGFNQSNLIGEGISETLNIPLLKDVLHRVKNTTTQTDKNRQERIDNVKDAFVAMKKGAVENKHILLLDDVLTTGATIESCANELLKIKGVRLSIATVGIAV